MGFGAFIELQYKNDKEVATISPELAITKDDFVLNKDEYDEVKTSILMYRDKFGCEFSREHALWSINDMGIRYIKSTSFVDIFYSNCFNNIMLTIILPHNQVDALLEDKSVL